MTIPLVESLAKCMLVNCFPLVAAKIQIKMEQIMQPMIRLLFSAAICTIGLKRIIHQELKPRGIGSLFPCPSILAFDEIGLNFISLHSA